MIRVTSAQFAVAAVLAALAHGAALGAMALREPETAEAEPEALVFLELAALGDELGVLDPTAPTASAAPPTAPVDPDQLAAPEDDAALPTAPPPPDASATETVPREEPIEEDPLYAVPPDVADPTLPEPPPAPALEVTEIVPPEEALEEDPLDELAPDLADPVLPEPPPVPEFAAIETPPPEDPIEDRRPAPLEDLAIEPDVLPDAPERPELVVAELHIDEQRITPLPLPDEINRFEPTPPPLDEPDLPPPPPDEVDADAMLLEPDPLPEPPPPSEPEQVRLDELPPPPERTREHRPDTPPLTIAAMTPPPPPEQARPITEALPPLTPRRDPLAELPKPRAKPKPLQVAATPPAAPRPEPAPAPVPRQVAPAPPPPQTQVASAPAAVVPPAAAPTVRRGVSTGDARAKYAGNIHRQINYRAQSHYPRKAAKRGEEGVVPLRLEVGIEGELLSLTVLDESLASRRLIKAAIKAVERSAPFPSFAPEMGDGSAIFEVKILYKLR